MATRNPGELRRRAGAVSPPTIGRSPDEPVISDPPSRPPRSGITIWGPPTTGKTAFLAVLDHALAGKPSLGWRVVGRNDISTNELANLMTTMVSGGTFPRATQDLAIYEWELVKWVRKRSFTYWLWLRAREVERAIPLRVVDAPGGFANPGVWEETPVAKELVEAITNSAGIVFIYDPTREFQEGDAYRHTYSVLAHVDSASEWLSGRLPHFLAVCVAKFDDQRVYDSAAMVNMAAYDSENGDVPYVDEEFAEEFFNRMCQIPTHPAAHGLLKMIKPRFHEKRMKFFVTSAVGFYVNPATGRFDPGDCENVVPGEPPRVRSDIRPINIAECVDWLANKVDRAARR
jgi:hypothetical protein